MNKALVGRAIVDKAIEIKLLGWNVDSKRNVASDQYISLSVTLQIGLLFDLFVIIKSSGIINYWNF